VAIGAARNAGLLAVRILGANDPALRARMLDFQAGLERAVLAMDAGLDGAADPAGGPGPE
jgi:5-(carboxyamino)imidazole ribonucleotide mutase